MADELREMEAMDSDEFLRRVGDLYNALSDAKREGMFLPEVLMIGEHMTQLADRWFRCDVNASLARGRKAEEAWENLREYGRHQQGCSAGLGDQYRCKCGWSEVQRRMGGVQ